ncbi:MAG: tripartite tricarboxylate transporter substrate binding protein [Proteobacteria bacterium]|nr:tripartite tricarboxylate transporter substrate binding protein [Pseudomonadota bacterium]
MNSVRDRIAVVAVAAVSLAVLLVSTQAAAQNYPTKPIRVIVPYPPGGTSDILTRLVGAKLTEAWGQQILADNRTGAGGNIGAELMVRAAPDGYTLMLTDIGNLVTSTILYAKLPFDLLRDFAPVVTVSYSPHLLAVHPSVPVKTVKELVALAKSKPGKLNYAAGLGGTPHLAGLMFAQRTGINWVYIPTKGGAATSYAVATGDADVLFLGILQTLTHISSGKLKLIASSSAQRLSNLPDTPTVAESLPGFVTGSWQGILAPARTPPDVIAKLNNEVARVLKLNDVREVLTSQGTTPLATGPQETGRWLTEEKERWTKVVKESGFKLE